MPKQVTLQLNSFQDGLSKSIYQGGKNQFAPGTREMDFMIAPGIIQPNLTLANQADLQTNNPVNRNVRAVIRASNATYYWAGQDAAGTPLARIMSGDPSADTSLTLLGAGGIAASNYTNGTKIAEFDDDLFFYVGGTDLHKFDIGGAALSSQANGSALTNNIGLDLLNYKTFLFYCNSNNVGRAINTTTYNNTALVLETRYRVTSLTPWFGKVIVGARTQNEGGNSRLFIWDGVSTLVDYSVEVPDTGLAAAVNNEGIIFIFCGSNPNGNADRNILRIYIWAGGDKVQLLRELDLENSAVGSFQIRPAGVSTKGGKVYFTLDAGTTNTMTIANGVYSIDSRGVLNFEYIDAASQDTADLSGFYCQWIEGDLFWFFGDGTNNRKQNHNGLTYSSQARLDTVALQFDPRYESRIDEIFFRTISLPASVSIAVSIATDQASFSAVKTFDADNAVFNIAINQNDFAFQPGTTHQLRFAFTSSSASRVRIILPIFIRATVFDAQTLTS